MAGLSIGYINLRKSKVASENLSKVSDRDVELITEPYSYKDNVRCLGSSRTLFQPTAFTLPVCVWVKNSLNLWQVEEYTSRDVCTVAMERKGKVVYLAAVYLDIDDPPAVGVWVDLVKHCNRREIPLLLCMDCMDSVMPIVPCGTVTTATRGARS